jgi:hypothetical protein
MDHAPASEDSTPPKYAMRTRTSYLTNKDLLAEIIACQITNTVSDKLAKYLMLMIHRISYKPCWRNYSYLSDMQAEAIYQLVRVNHPQKRTSSKPADDRPNILKYDPSFAERAGRPQNPFAYATQIIVNSFRKCLKEESKLSEFRDDAMEHAGHTPTFRRQQHNEANRSSDPIVKKTKLSKRGPGRPKKPKSQEPQ